MSESKKTIKSKKLIGEIGSSILLILLLGVMLEMVLEISIFHKYSGSSIFSNVPFNETTNFKFSKVNQTTVMASKAKPTNLLKTKEDKTQTSEISGRTALSFGYLEGSSRENSKLVYYAKTDDGYERRTASYKKLLFRKSKDDKATITDGQRAVAKMDYLTPTQAQIIYNRYKKENVVARWVYSVVKSDSKIKSDLRKNTYTENQAQKVAKSYNRRVLNGTLAPDKYDASHVELTCSDVKILKLPGFAFKQVISF